jgi:hypothetical protein
MSVRNGFDSIRILLNAIPNTQVSGVWVGNNISVTTLDPGIYFVNYNVSYTVNGAGPITNSQTVITRGNTFTSGLGQVLVATPLTGQMGLLGNASMRQTLCNTCIITAENTPIYVYLSCTLTGQWGTTNANEVGLNTISFTKISNL